MDFVETMKYIFKEDRIKNYLEKMTVVHLDDITKRGIRYTVVDEIPQTEIERLQVLFKKNIRYYQKGFNRYVIVYHRGIAKPEYKETTGLYVGATLDGDLVLPLNKEVNNFLIVGASGSGKSNLCKNLIKSAIYNHIQVTICNNKYDSEYDCFKGYCEVYKDVDKCVDIIHQTLLQCDRIAKKGLKTTPNLLIIDELYPFLTMKNKKEIYSELGLLLSRCRAADVHCLLICQKATVDVIPSLITANINHRIAMKVSSEQESINILHNTKAFHINEVGTGYYRCNDTFQLFKSPKFINDLVPRVQVPPIKPIVLDLTKTKPKEDGLLC